MLGFDAIGRLALGQGPTTPPTAAISEDSWHQPFSTDRDRRRPPYATANQQFASFVEADPFPEAVSADRWFVPFSEPTRFGRRFPTSSQQFAAFVEPFIVPVDRWLTPFSEPTRFRRQLHASQQQFASFVKADPFPESVSADKWLMPFSEPVRIRPRLVTANQWFGRGIEFPLTAINVLELVTFSGSAGLTGVPTGNYKNILSSTSTRRLVYAVEISPWTISSRDS